MDSNIIRFCSGRAGIRSKYFIMRSENAILFTHIRQDVWCNIVNAFYLYACQSIKTQYKGANSELLNPRVNVIFLHRIWLAVTAFNALIHFITHFIPQIKLDLFQYLLSKYHYAYTTVMPYYKEIVLLRLYLLKFLRRTYV